MYTLTDTAKATILLCSHLSMTDRRYRPFTPLEWNKLGQVLVASEVKEPGKLLGMSAKEIQEALKLSATEAERIEVLLARGVNVAFTLDMLAKRSIFVVTKSDAAYPTALKQFLPPSKMPPVLFYCGDLSLAESDGIAIVGSRDLDTEGELETKRLAAEAVHYGFTVYSGGARGVDSIAAQTSLSSGGRTVAFLSDSLERRIKKRQVRESIQSGHMLLLSAILPSAGFSVGNAMARNKYVYALSQAAFVIASSKDSGGTWAGALESLKEGYAPVYVWKTTRYPGNEALIQRGAHPFGDAIDWRVVARGVQSVRRSDLTMDSLFTNKTSSDSSTNALLADSPAMETVSESRSMISSSDEATVFQAVWPLLHRALRETDSEGKLLDLLGKDVVKKQLHIWLQLAMEKGLVVRKTHPIRYQLSHE